MFRFLCLVAFLSAFLSRAPASASVQAHNAQGPLFVDIYVPEQNYARQSGRYSVPRAQVLPTSVRVIATITPNGWTGIENTTHYQWPTATWFVGFNTTMKHVGGSAFHGSATTYGWSNTTTQDMGAMYNSVLVGPNQPFDGEVDWVGPSGRSWNIRGQRILDFTLTSNLEAWTQGDAQGLHSFDIVFKPTGGFAGGSPTSHWQGFATGHARVLISVQYTYP